MSTLAVVGMQWGDEGKGRVVDWLAADADVVARFQGGDNAGHTVVHGDKVFKLHLVPSGIFRPEVRCVVGAGCAVNPDGLLAELAELHRADIDTQNLWLDARAHVVMPWHLVLDGIEERSRSAKAQIGTTRRGIGPCYTDKAGRRGVRLGDLLRPDVLVDRLTAAADWHDVIFAHFGEPAIDRAATLARCESWAAALGERIVDTAAMLEDAVDAGRQVLLEGQLGVMRDLDWGAYPFVTSSNPTAAFAAAGAGLGAHAIDDVVGVVKAYVTSVGAGPLPTELLGAEGDHLRTLGGEYGATTGRPRRCGWLDAVALRYAARRNGVDRVVLTKLDILDTIERISVAVAYDVDGVRTERMPPADALGGCAPVYAHFDGWRADTTAVRHFDALPPAAQAYVRAVERLGGVRISHVSVGPDRDAILAVPVMPAPIMTAPIMPAPIMTVPKMTVPSESTR